MKRIVLLLILLSTTLGLAQVGVNTTTPDPSSMLDVTATNKGALFPRVSLSNINLTTLDGTNTAATGLLIWNTNPATIGGNGIGYYYFNGTVWTPINQSASSDADWYQVLTSSPSNNISNSIYTQGNVTIGNNSIGGSAKLNVFSNATSNSVRIDNSGTIGLENQGLLISNGSLVGPTTARFVGVSNSLSSSSGFAQTGFKNNFSNLTSNVIYNGVENDFPVSGTNGFQKGMRNYFGGGQSASGIENLFPIGATYSSITYGVTNSLSSQGNGAKYGVHNSISGSGSGFKYGTYNVIDPLAGGIHYGLYSEALKTGSYAGYFLGNVSIGSTATDNYILPPSRGSNGQIMQTDGAGTVSWVTPTATTDSDWFELGTTTTANAITDNIYTQGTVSVGSSTLSNGKFNTYNSSENNSLYAENTGSPAAASSVAYFLTIGTGAHPRFGIQNFVFGDGTGGKYGIQNSVNTSSTDSQTGVGNFLGGSNANFVYGFRNTINTSGSATQQQYGLHNNFSTNSDSQITGVYNFTTSDGNGIHYGVHNRNTGAGNGLKYGTYNFIIGNGAGLRYGNYNYIGGSGTSSKYGTYNLLDPLAGGTHYGLYSEALKTGSYAGYFLGNVSVGTTTSNNYILPPSRGTNGQIMQTDAAGNVSWVTPTVVTDTDDQGTDVFSLTGNTLNLSLQNDGVATQTVDLSSLKDADWYEVGGTNPANSITDNIYTSGDVSIGKSTSAISKMDIEAQGKTSTLNLRNNNTSTGIKTGINNNLFLETTNDFSSAILNNVSGNVNYKYGVNNNLSGNITLTGTNYEFGVKNTFNTSGNVNSTGLFNDFFPLSTHNQVYTGVHNDVGGSNHIGPFVGVRNAANYTTDGYIIGLDNSIGGAGIGNRYGILNSINATNSGTTYGVRTNITGNGSGLKYGELITIPSSTGGQHFGLYSDVLKSGSYAGYFLGNVSVGTTTTNNYILPPSRGTNGQIMQTDGAGNVSWADAPSDADWYEVGGISAANSILDNIYTSGDVSIGKVTAATGKVDIEADNKTQTLVLENNNASTGAKFGILNNLTVNTSNPFSSAIQNTISGNTSFKRGVSNLFNYNHLGASITENGVNTDFFSTGDINFIGGSNYVSSNTTGYIIGYQNTINGTTTAVFTGFVNYNSTNNNNAKTGLLNSLGGGGSGSITGTFNSLSSSSNGEHIGTGTYISSFGTGLKYGEKIEIDNTSGGLHFGVYADVTKANSFAGYFLGRVSLGTTTANNYILPSSRGTLGQIMVTNGTGDVSWVNPSIIFSDTDDQQIDVLSLTGDTLNISLQDDGVATQTLNLGAIDNQGTDVFSLTGNTLNLSVQNDGVPTQTVDLSPLANDWKLTGNAGTVAGTNFIGTTDAQDLSFRTNNLTRLTLTQRGQLSITNTGGSVLVGSGAGDADDFTLNQNTFIGTVSGESTSSGNLNSALGFNSLNGNTLGLGNTAVGANALNANVDGNNNTGVGRGANVSTTNLTNATAVGFNSTVNAANKIRLGNVAITVVEGQVAYTNPSDARFKFNVQENVPGLDFIKKLKPVTYNFDTKKFDEHLNRNRSKDDTTNEDFSTSTAIIRTGFLAQDVEKICTDLGYNFDGLHVPDASNPTDNYGIAYSQFIMPIVKAVQEQQVIIETQKTELEQLKSELEKYKALEERIKALEQK